MQGKRKYVRFRASFLLKFKNEFTMGIQGVAKDVSMGGLKVVLDKSATALKGRLLSFYLLLPGKTLEISGEAAWLQAYDGRIELGIKFVNIADAHKEDIYSYISTYYRKELTHKWWKE